MIQSEENDPIVQMTTSQLIHFLVLALGGDMEKTLNAPPPPKPITDYIQQADLGQLRRLALDVTARLDTCLNREPDGE